MNSEFQYWPQIGHRKGRKTEYPLMSQIDASFTLTTLSLFHVTAH